MKTKFFLGNLEQDIMEIVWQADRPVSVRLVVSALQARRKIAYTTVMTVMMRLSQDGYLVRRMGPDHSYLYSAAETRQAFGARISRQNIDELVSHYGDAALAQFLSRVERIPPEKLTRLKRLAKQRSHARE